MVIRIANEQDRRTIAGILVANGYTVRLTKIVVGKTKKTVLEVEESEE